MITLGKQRPALPDSEAMLLVNNHQSQLLVGYPLGNRAWVPIKRSISPALRLPNRSSR